jgi:hypothetical protein
MCSNKLFPTKIWGSKGILTLENPQKLKKMLIEALLCAGELRYMFFLLLLRASQALHCATIKRTRVKYKQKKKKLNFKLKVEYS